VSEWETDETITATKLNQKEVYIGSSAPSSPTDGELWFDTVNRKLKYYDANAAAWRVVPRVLTDLESRSHADLQNVGTDDHHPKIHGHSEHSFGEAEVVANKNQPNGYAGLDANGMLDMKMFKTKPSANVRNSNDASKSTSSGTYVKLKEMKINEQLNAYRVYFTIKNMSGGAEKTYACIYKNGSPIGTERQTSSTTGETFSEDFTANPLSPGDLLQIYVKTTNGTWGYVSDFRLAYDLADITRSVTNQDP